ncbi:hypothetical protein LXA43DRAFT_536818 [Ganoderma leucocontextum]|nr:hypothetical protein LXA43DRAFT_536818 [Ganoderma leucocontextum]
MYSEISSKTSRNRHLSVTESITQLEQSFEHRLSDLCYLDASTIHNSIIEGYTLKPFQARSAVPRLLAVFRKLSDNTNAVAPINGLPPELHRMIFKQATAPRTGDPFHGRSILTLTHVCRLWRDTVVGAASLWCHIDLNAKEPLAALFVQRSSGLPITLHLSTRDEGKLKLMRGILKQHTARVRAIHMDDGCIEPPQVGYWGSASSALGSFYFYPKAPLPVECFFLRGWLYSPNRTPEWALFNGNTSPLKALSLVVNYVWDWKWMPTNPLPNLTHLYLSSLSHGELRPRYSAESLLRMLSGTSMLQYLHLTSVGLLIDPSKIRNTLPVVRLDHVHTMSIHQSDLEVAFFLLAHLDLPDDILLCIDGARSGYPPLRRRRTTMLSGSPHSVCWAP